MRFRYIKFISNDGVLDQNDNQEESVGQHSESRAIYRGYSSDRHRINAISKKYVEIRYKNN